jgi:NarL family two-component system response regulator LiaR
MAEPITILIVDDHAVVRSGLQAYLAASVEFEVVGEAASGEEAVDLVKQNKPDVVLMDLILPGMNGSEATSMIKKINPRTKVVVLTSTHNEDLIFSAFKSGADSCILKDMKMEYLTNAIKKAVNEEVSLHPRIAAKILRNLKTIDKIEEKSPFSLSEIETSILELKSKGFSNRKISDKLNISEEDVRELLNEILNKLHLIGQTQTILIDSHPE